MPSRADTLTSVLPSSSAGVDSRPLDEEVAERLAAEKPLPEALPLAGGHDERHEVFLPRGRGPGSSGASYGGGRARPSRTAARVHARRGNGILGVRTSAFQGPPRVHAMHRRTGPFLLAVSCLVAGLAPWAAAVAQNPAHWLVVDGGDGPGKGKRIVLVSGDEEYRSEEAVTQLAKILATRHGFTCTVLYAIDPATGEISPNTGDNIPGLASLRDADLMVIATRFRNLPDEQMKEVDDYLRRGRPVIGMRTATHAFNIPKDRAYHHYSWNQSDPRMPQGFGRQVLGETWINHHGHHGKESTRGLIAPEAKDHPILRGLKDGDIWGDTDVYGVRLPLPGDSKPLVLGQVLEGMTPDAPVVEGADAKKNDPMMPVAWTKTYAIEGGPAGRVFTTTMGSSSDLASAGTRRMLVNACYWALGMEDRIPAATNVDLVGTFEPTKFGFNGAKKGLKPADLK